MALLLLIAGPLAALRTPTDIFPEIRIPVIGVVWSYTGLPPEQMAGRITTPFQRALTTTVNDIEHIVAKSYNGVGIIKIFFQPNVDIRTPTRRSPPRADHAQAVAAGRDAALDTELQRLHGADHPARAVGRGADRQNMFDIATNHCARRWSPCRRGDPLAVRRQARQIQIDLNPTRCNRSACRGRTSANALAAQNLIVPVGSQKIGNFEYTSQLNNSPLRLEELGNLPIKVVNGATATSATWRMCVTATARRPT